MNTNLLNAVNKTIEAQNKVYAYDMAVIEAIETNTVTRYQGMFFMVDGETLIKARKTGREYTVIICTVNKDTGLLSGELLNNKDGKKVYNTVASRY